MKNFFLYLILSLACLGISALFFSKSQSGSAFLDFYEAMKSGSDFSYNYSWNSETNTQVKTFSAEKIEAISVQGDYVNIKIEPADVKDRIEFKVTHVKEDSKLLWSDKKEVIDLSVEALSKNSPSSRAQILIKIPRDKKDLVAQLKTKLGGVKVNELSFKKLDIKTQAGAFKATQIKADRFRFKANAGALNLSESRVKILNAKTDQGAINISLKNSDPVADIKTSAGAIKFKVKDPKNFKLKIKSSFGSVNVAEGYKKTKKEIYVFGQGAGSVDLKADLGAIKVL